MRGFDWLVGKMAELYYLNRQEKRIKSYYKTHGYSDRNSPLKTLISVINERRSYLKNPRNRRNRMYEYFAEDASLTNDEMERVIEELKEHAERMKESITAEKSAKNYEDRIEVLNDILEASRKESKMLPQNIILPKEISTYDHFNEFRKVYFTNGTSDAIKGFVYPIMGEVQDYLKEVDYSRKQKEPKHSRTRKKAFEDAASIIKEKYPEDDNWLPPKIKDACKYIVDIQTKIDELYVARQEVQKRHPILNLVPGVEKLLVNKAVNRKPKQCGPKVSVFIRG
jgi:DNA primase catalytic subunit